MKNHYLVLELEPTATLDQIKSQHRFLMHAWHPDKFPAGELRDRAERKIKEINEAYRILSDPTKRAQYDNTLESRKTTLPSASASGRADESPYGRPLSRCESCGMPAETKYVEFYENVGMIFMRQHRSIKGKLCKSCIDCHFWNLTGKTMLLGWWGTISLIVTPFFLLNNLFRFVSTLSMRRNPLSITPSPSPFWIFTTIGGVLLSGSLLSSMVLPLLVVPTMSVVPTATARVARPTLVPTRQRTPTPVSNCIPWSAVSVEMIGRNACVYGDVAWLNDPNGNFQIHFANGKEFFLASGTYYYDVIPGDCVVAEGEILRSGEGIPYINITEGLYKCEPWMR